MDFKEAVHTSELPQLLRDGLQALMFSEYSMTAALYPSITTEESSDNEREYLIEQAMFGTLPTVGEGDPYPELATPGLYPERVVANTKKGAIFAVTEEMIKFDKLGYIKDQVMDFGRVAKETTEDLVATVYTTAGNYTLNSTTNDNDIGANTAATRFSAQGLELAFSTLATGKTGALAVI